MVALSMVLVFLLALSRGESELDAKISSPEKVTEWGDPDLSLPGSCQPAPTCQKCILSHPSCAWCKQLVTELGARKEKAQPQQRTEVPGEPQQLRVRFLRAEGYPVDLYYLMDLSYSMKDDLERVRQLGQDLLARLQEVTHSVRIGELGLYLQKPLLSLTVPSKLHHPCPTRLERCQPPFSFRHVLSLTSDAKAFEREVGRQSVSGNLDSPEGGFDAILQAALCQEQIGWRNVSRLLVFTSDDTFHTAGDGKLGGIFMPSDGHCHLDSNGLYSRSPEFDYPSVGQVAQALSAANIQPIFAVTSATLPVYQELSKLIPKSAVGELSEDSSNVVQLIMDAYNSLSSTVTLEHSPLPPGVHISYESQCGGPEEREREAGDRGQCNEVRINQTVNFLVTIQATHCLSEPHLLRLRALGFSEELTVELHTLCDCNCSDTQPRAPHCSDGQGLLQCGVCRDCAECGAFGTGPLATNCSIACADANVTLVLDPIPDDGWCKERTLDNQLFFFLVEEEARGRVILRVRAQERVNHTLAIVLGCVGGIVAVGLGLVLAYRLSVEIYDRQEYNRFEKERQQLNWKQDSNPLYRSAITTTVNPRFQEARSPFL
uniref:Integrin beta n=1 Tax=Panthera tigris altaica TaxID=74533 RepID=A0A8C9JIN1_PANTA